MAQGYRNIAGTWRQGMLWRNVGGTWKLGTLWRNIGGTWKMVAPGVVFTPDGGTIRKATIGPVSTTLSCTQPAVWTYSALPTQVTASISSGSTATSITFSDSARDNNDYSFTARGVANGIQRDFNITLTSGNTN